MFTGTLASTRNAPWWTGGGGALDAPGTFAPVEKVAGSQPSPTRSRLSQLGPLLLAFSGNPLGGFLLRQRAEQDQFAQQQQLAEQRRQQAMQDARANFMFEQDYRASHPQARQPTQTDRYIAEILDPQTDPRRRALLQAVVTRPQQVYNPQTGAMEWQYPGMGAGQSAPTQGLTDEQLDALERGGPSQPATGGFR